MPNPSQNRAQQASAPTHTNYLDGLVVVAAIIIWWWVREVVAHPLPPIFATPPFPISRPTPIVRPFPLTPPGSGTISKTSENIRDTGLTNVTDADITIKLNDPITSKKEKKRLVKEQKSRGPRNIRKRKEK